MTCSSVDCRAMPGDNDCDVKTSGSEEHVVAAAAVHMVMHHGHADTPEPRGEVCGTMKPETAA